MKRLGEGVVCHLLTRRNADSHCVWGRFLRKQRKIKTFHAGSRPSRKRANVLCILFLGGVDKD